MRLLLTGSNGFIGSRIATAALDHGWQVIGVGRSVRPTGPVSSYHRHDLTRPLDLDEQVDAVVHCAALASPWASPQHFQANNVDATSHVVSWAQDHGSPPLVFVSSSSVLYRNADQLDLTEESPVPGDAEQINTYSRTKLAGERLVRAYSGPWTILRPRAVFGPGDTVLLPRLIEAARRGQLPLFSRPDGHPVVTDLTYVDVVAQYTLTAIERGATGVYHLTNGQPVELYPFLFDVLDRLGQPRPTRRVPVGVAMALAGAGEAISAAFLGYREPPITRFGVSMFAYSKTFDITACRRDLGDPPVSLAEGVQQLVAWWATQGRG